MLVTGVVVLYNPDDSVIDNVKTYVNHLSVLYAMDNSEKKNELFVERLLALSDKIVYIWNGENKGIAYALNLAARKSLELGADWLLTMDQDGKFEPGNLEKLIESCLSCTNDDLLIVSPTHLEVGIPRESLKSSGNPFPYITMTSGNMLNLRNYKKNGPFREDFFIDYVDNEYCLRAKKNGLKVIELKDVCVDHRLGKAKRVLNFTPTNHPPIRRYYITRNRVAVWREYYKVDPAYVRYDMWAFVKETAKIVLGEDQKLEKVKMIVKGLSDSLRGKFGKLSS